MFGYRVCSDNQSLVIDSLISSPPSLSDVKVRRARGRAPAGQRNGVGHVEHRSDANRRGGNGRVALRHLPGRVIHIRKN